jgi:hypothetical protein
VPAGTNFVVEGTVDFLRTQSVSFFVPAEGERAYILLSAENGGQIVCHIKRLSLVPGTRFVLGLEMKRGRVVL